METQTKRINTRDAAVELFRIFACLVVIGTHIKLSARVTNGVVNQSRIMIGTFFGEGVTMFYFILGFFYFNNKSFKKLCKKTFKSILIPVLIYLAFASVFLSWITNEDSFWSCIMNIRLNTFEEMIRSICILKFGKVKCAPHLWYIFPYLQCIMWFPMLRYLGNNTKARRYFEIIGISSLFLDDLQSVVELPVAIGNFALVTIPILELLIGYELYLKKDIFKKYKWQSRVGGWLYT